MGEMGLKRIVLEVTVLWLGRSMGEIKCNATIEARIRTIRKRKETAWGGSRAPFNVKPHASAWSQGFCGYSIPCYGGLPICELRDRMDVGIQPWISHALGSVVWQRKAVKTSVRRFMSKIRFCGSQWLEKQKNGTRQSPSHGLEKETRIHMMYAKPSHTMQAISAQDVAF